MPRYEMEAVEISDVIQTSAGVTISAVEKDVTVNGVLTKVTATEVTVDVSKLFD